MFRMVLRGTGLMAWAIATLGLLAGCGSSDEIEKASVEGTVTLDGEPIHNGAIAFIPSDGKGPTAEVPIEEGAYSAEVPLGPKRVEITSPKVVGRKKKFDTPDSPTVEITEESLPPKYNTRSELTFTVDSIVTEKDFELTSK